MNVCDYVNTISKNISNLGGNESDVFNSNVSNAIVMCFNVMSTYARLKGIKEIPAPFSVMGKTNDCMKHLNNNNDFSLLKFDSNLNLDIMLLNKVIMDLGYSEYINVEPFSICTNVEICVPVLVNNVKQ